MEKQIPTSNIPLLKQRNETPTHQQNPQLEKPQEDEFDDDVIIPISNPIDNEIVDPQLEKALKKLEFYLSFLGYNQHSYLKFVSSWAMFIGICVVIPVAILEITLCDDCDDYQVRDFEYEILSSQVLLGAVSLVCLSKSLYRRGIRHFLFVDKLKGHNESFKGVYLKEIHESYRMLIMTLLPCCILKFVHEFTRMLYVHNQSWWQAGLVVLALVLSWTYLSAITIVACVLFHLACSLQIIHYGDYTKYLETGSSIQNLIDEHIRLRGHLSKISHRFRKYLLLVFLIVTASLFMTLIQITGVNGKVTFLNGGNFAVSSLVQVIETLLILHAGTKISHRAQGIGAVASKWHALVSSKSFDESRRSISTSSLSSYCSEDLDEDSISVRNHPQFASVSNYNKRQSFVMYLQTNPGGITLYGWVVDRSFLNTIFFFELSLVLFVLGQTIIFSSSPS